MPDKAQIEASKAASLLGKRSAETRRREWGEKEFLRRMREYGKLGGRPRKTATKQKEGRERSRG